MSQKKNTLKPIDTPVYGYWSALYRSFYSRRLYVDVGKRWRGVAILYLLLSITIFSIPFVVRMDFSFNEAFKQQIIDPLQDIPIFYIQNGVVNFDKPMPYLVKDNKGNVVVIIDTTGAINDFSKYPFLTILVNKNKISLKAPQLQLFNMIPTKISTSAPVVQDFDKETNLVFNGKQIAQESIVMNLKHFAEVLMYPMTIATLFPLFFIFFLVLGFLGQIFSNVFFSMSISLTQSCRLLIVSGTPMLLFLMMMLTTNFIFTGSGFVLLFLLIAYYSFSLHALRAESKRIVAHD